MGAYVKRIILLAIALAFSQNAYAQQINNVSGNITFAQGGWVNSSLRVQLAGVQFNNPDNCAVNDGFITDPADQGNSLFNSMLLSAYMANKKVELTISGCIVSRPKIIGVAFVN